MQDLSHYNAAAFLTDGMKTGPQFVRVIRGARSGTVGKIVEINAKYYSAHEYRIAVKGHRSFWMKGADLEYVADHAGETTWINDPDYQVHHDDMLGRRISEGCTLAFHRQADGNGTEMVLGTVKKISKCGAVYVKPFKTARSEEVPQGLIKVGVPRSSMVVARDTVDAVLLAKLSMF